jgi:hypothetical protein
MNYNSRTALTPRIATLAAQRYAKGEPVARILRDLQISKSNFYRALQQQREQVTRPLGSVASSFTFDVPPDPRTLYQIEKEKRAHRVSPAISAAQQALEERLARESHDRRGGRPKGSKNGQAFQVALQPKVRVAVPPKDPADALWQSLGRYEGR